MNDEVVVVAGWWVLDGFAGDVFGQCDIRVLGAPVGVGVDAGVEGTDQSQFLPSKSERVLVQVRDAGGAGELNVDKFDVLSFLRPVPCCFGEVQEITHGVAAVSVFELAFDDIANLIVDVAVTRCHKCRIEPHTFDRLPMPRRHRSM